MWEYVYDIFHKGYKSMLYVTYDIHISRYYGALKIVGKVELKV